MKPLRFSALILFLPQLPLSAQYEFTNNFVGDNSWTNPKNWKLPGLDPATDFPDNGAQALVPHSTVKLTKNILLNSLEARGLATIDLNGNTLTVNGTFVSDGADGLTDGTFDSQNLQLTTGIILSNTTATTGGITANTNAVTLINGSSLLFNGTATLLGNGGFSGGGLGSNTLTNQGGILTKAGGAAFADVSAAYTQNGGSTGAEVGALRFTTDATINGGSLASTTRLLFAGPTAFNSPTVNLTDNGRVECLGPLALGGTLTSSHTGTGTTPGIEVSGGFSGGTLDCDVAAPFVMTGGSSSPVTPTTNLGAFFWDTGTLNDFTNNSDTRGEFVINNYSAAPGASTLAGQFINNGHVLQEIGGALNLTADAVFENQAGATYELLGGNIGVSGVASGHQFLNSGTFLRPAQAEDGFITISVPFNSTGEIRVLDNGLRIQGPGSLSGTLLCDRSARPDALLEIGGGGQVISLGDTVFDCLGNGLIEFGSGEFRLSGLLESRESDGTVHVRSGGVDLVVESGSSAALAFNDFVPLLIGADNNQPEIRLAGPLTNTGRIDLFLARLLGAVPMKNTGEIYLDGTLDIGSGSEGGQLVNNGLIDFPTLNGLQIRLNADGLVVNNEPGGPDANLTGGTIIMGTGDSIGSTVSASTTQVTNKGAILATENGGAFIGAVFEQDGSNTPVVEAQRGTLSFTRAARFLSGEIRSTYLDFGTDPSPSDVRFSEDTVFGGATIVLGNGGKVTLAGTGGVDNDLFTLEATLTAQGNGLVEMTGGTLVPEAGNANTGFNCPADTRFLLSEGIVGAVGESLSNVGNFDQKGGAILGTFTNGGVQTIDDGSIFLPSIDGDFTNTGTLTLTRVKISGNFSNGTAVTPEAGEMEVNGPPLARELAAAANFTNWNILNQRASIHCDTDVVVRQNDGVLTMSESAGFFPVTSTSSTGHRFEMNGGVLRAEDTVERDHSIQLAAFEFNGGTLHALTGNFFITSPSLTVDGGEILCPAGRGVRFEADAVGPGFKEIAVDGEVVFDFPSSADSPTASLRADGILRGSGTLRVDLTQNGEVAPGNSTGTLTLDGDLTQTATSTTRIEISPTANDVLAVTGTAALDGTLSVTLIDGAAPTLGQEFTILTATSVTGTFDSVEVLGGFVGDGFDVTYNATSVVLTATRTGDDYAAWAANEFTVPQLADPLFSGPKADPDKDGISNFAEFISGGSPTAGGDPNPISFRADPDPSDSTRRIPVYEVATVTGRGGYRLEIIGLGDLANAADDAFLPSATTGVIGGIITLRADDSLPDSAAFFALGAALAP